MNDDGTCADGFTSSNAEGRSECLKVKDGMDVAASRLETRRYASMMGATTEFRKMEGIAYDPDHNKVYLAMSEVAKAMEGGSKGDKGGRDDIKLAKNRVEGYRNFGTKLCNAARFCEMNQCALPADFEPAKVKQTVNQWIVGETARVAAETAQGIEAYKFNEAAGGQYQFVWNTFCDWYLEFIKPILNGDDAEAAAETRATAAWVRASPRNPTLAEGIREAWNRSATKPMARSTSASMTRAE